MHVTLYEVSEESQFSDSVWWLYEPAQKEKVKLPFRLLFVLYMGVACMSYIVLGKKLDKIEILARTQGLKRDTNKRVSVV